MRSVECYHPIRANISQYLHLLRASWLRPRHPLGLFSARFAGELSNESPEMIEKNFAETEKRPSVKQMLASRNMSASAKKRFQDGGKRPSRKRKS